MRLRMISKKDVLVDQDVSKVTLPAMEGKMEILPGHAGMIVIIKSGKISYDDSMIRVQRGVVRVFNDEVLVLVN